MPRLNSFFGFRCTKDEQLMLDATAKKRGGRRLSTIELYQQNIGLIDKKALANLFTSIFEPRFAKRMIRRYCHG